MQQTVDFANALQDAIALIESCPICPVELEKRLAAMGWGAIADEVVEYVSKLI